MNIQHGVAVHGVAVRPPAYCHKVLYAAIQLCHDIRSLFMIGWMVHQRDNNQQWRCPPGASIRLLFKKATLELQENQCMAQAYSQMQFLGCCWVW